MSLAAATVAPGQTPPPNYDESKIPAYDLPDPLLDSAGKPITMPDQWPARRTEIFELFENHVFGKMPAQRRVKTALVRTDPNHDEGKTTRYELTVTVQRPPEEVQASDQSTSPTRTPAVDSIVIHVLVDVPNANDAASNSAAPSNAADSPGVPAFLGLNFQGNHTITTDPRVRLPATWVRNRNDGTTQNNLATPTGRGVAASRWPMAMISERGYATIALYYGDIDPDFDDGFENGIHALIPNFIAQLPPEQRPGSIAAWAYGVSCVLDAIEQTPALGIDASRVAILGHSRLGKTALWAGAIDPRFALVVSNNSGCGGAALSRRAIGERVGRINRSFPHWFCDGFLAYNENENALPVDSHELVALSAPRPVAIGSATEDTWADPKGEFLAGNLASPVYQLLGKPGMLDEKGESPINSPAPDHAFSSGSISYHLRTGKHDLNESDWLRYLDFADRHFHPQE